MKRLFSALLCFVMLLAAAPMQPRAEQADLTAVKQEAVLAALYEADIPSLRQALEEGLITSEELTQYYLDRISQYDAPYNCFITLCDNALEVARQRDAAIARGEGNGSLFGIPIVVKDNMNVTGYHTTNGRNKTKSQIAKSNAAVVEYLLSEGAVILAKANMSTDAQSALHSYSQVAGETSNAYNQYLSAGGSSGGSAVSVSLNFAAASLGTDTNSSLRIPAALAGCVSLRTTHGKLSMTGIKKLNSTRDVPGAITRTVRDQAIMLDVLTQGEHRYEEQLDANALSGMRIGVLKQLSYATTTSGTRSDRNIDGEVAEAFATAIAELKACGADVVEVSWPALFTLSDKTFATAKSSAKKTLYNAFLELLKKENIAAVIYPSYLSTPLHSGKDQNGHYWDVHDQININNCRTLAPCAGIPEISVPIGIHSMGAGIGMEIAAPKDAEQLLLNIAYSYTAKYDHRQPPTGAPNAYKEHYEGSVGQIVEVLHAPPPTEPELQKTPAATKPGAVQNNPQTEKEPDTSPAWLLILLVVAVAVAVQLWMRHKAKKRRKRRRPAFIKE